MSGFVDAGETRHASWSDERLVRLCLEGDQEAWAALLRKYQNLIFSIPIKYGFSRDEAGDIFQQVCMQLLSALPAIREPNSLGPWLAKTTSHRCFHVAGQAARMSHFDLDSQESELPALQKPPDTVLREVELEQLFRDALSKTTPRCRELIQMLFFQTPSVPYEEVAKNLGIAKGSIGFIRMHCLKRLRRLLEEKGFR
jgi:RNA polymerase sigma factor (sigma-70 family)